MFDPDKYHYDLIDILIFLCFIHICLAHNGIVFLENALF